MPTRCHPNDSRLRLFLWSALWSALLASAPLAAGCESDNIPCTTCPPIEGSYAITFGEASTTGSCPPVGTPDGGTLEISRGGSALAGSYPGWDELRGTLYEGGEFTLSGGVQTGVDSVSIRGTFTGGRDGGAASLDGKWMENHPKSTPDGGDCTIDRAFTGARR